MTPNNRSKTVGFTESILRIVIIGKTGSGKSATGNTILRKDVFKEDSSSSSVTKVCAKEDGEVDGRHVSVIDCPGNFDTDMDEDHLKTEIERCITLSLPGPHVFLLVIRLGVRFTVEEQDVVQWIQTNFGDKASHYTIILFTHIDDLNDKTVEQCIADCPKLRDVVEHCGGRYIEFNNKVKESNDLLKLLDMINKMLKLNCNTHYTNEMYREAQRKIEEEERNRQEEERRKQEEERRRQEEDIRRRLEDDMRREEDKRRQEEENKKEEEQKKKKKRKKIEKNIGIGATAGGAVILTGAAITGAVTQIVALPVILGVTGIAALATGIGLLGKLAVNKMCVSSSI